MMEFFFQALFNNLNVKHKSLLAQVDTGIVNFIDITGWCFYVYLNM